MFHLFGRFQGVSCAPVERTPLGVAERPLHSFLANARTFRKAWTEKGTGPHSDGKVENGWKMDGKWMRNG